MMKILLHICCGPCSVGTFKALDRETHEVTGYWYNPNIHPYQEFKARLNSLKDYAKEIDLDLIVEAEYGLKHFINMVSDDLDNRCHKCYYDRIYHTALKAKELGFDAFTTTLLDSPYQMHELMVKISEDIALKVGVDFFYMDPRPYFRVGNNEARRMGQYMQKYCGCIFSEAERYLGKNKTK